jgi:hypothetical protein
MSIHDIIDSLIEDIINRHPVLTPKYTLAPFGNYIGIYPRTRNTVIATIEDLDNHILIYNSHETGKISIDLNDPTSLDTLHRHLHSIVSLLPDEQPPPVLKYHRKIRVLPHSWQKVWSPQDFS